jgi:hypothetical protein
MTSRLEIDLPNGNDTLRFGELVSFVDHARNAGATPDTPVMAVGADQDPDMLVALRVEFDDLAARQPADPQITREDVKELITILATIEDNEGDARSHLGTVRELRDHLTDIALHA